MNNHYLIEVTQVQKFFFSIDAESQKEAINKAKNHHNHDCELVEAMPPEVENITANCIGGD